MSTTRPDIPADVMRLAESRYTLATADYLSTPQMIAEAIVAERARFVERVETRAAQIGAGRPRVAFSNFAADLRAEGW
jgi:hypothetical protein